MFQNIAAIGKYSDLRQKRLGIHATKRKMFYMSSYFTFLCQSVQLLSVVLHFEIIIEKYFFLSL